MKLFSFLLFSISFFCISCDDCYKVDCPANQVWIRFQDVEGNDLLGLSSGIPNVKFAIGKEVFLPSSPANVSGNTLSFEQDFSPGIAIVDFMNKKDTIELINPVFDRKFGCCKLPFADSILVNKKVRMESQRAVLIR